ncbi:VWA domain-containing protein [bacterium]|nr:VWA domain-containing protein [bacterium]
MNVHWSTPVWMWPLLLVGAAGAVLWTVRAYRQTRPAPAAGLRRTLTQLRAAVFVLLIIALAGPVLSRLLVRARPAEVALLLEDSGSMAIADAGPDSAGGRWERALAVAEAVTAALDADGRRVAPVVLRGNGLGPLVSFGLQDPVVAPPTSHGTDLAGLRSQAADRLAGRPVRATVVISDGQETVAAAQGKAAGRAAPGALFVVGVGDAAGPPDRILKELRYPDTAYAGDEVVVEFVVDHRYLDGNAAKAARRLSARLVGPDGVVADTTLTIDQKLVNLELAFRPDRPGLQAYDLEVDVLDNERFPANNRASLAINVRQERARVLLLTGRPSWDVRFLAQAAAAEQRLALTVVRPSPRGLVLADSLTAWVPPVDAAGWRDWDAVVLMGWTGLVAAVDWTELGEAVEAGLGLLVLAGGESGPGGAPQGFPPPATLAEILPVDVATWRWAPGPQFLDVAAGGAGHPLLAGVELRSDAEGGVGLRELPPLAEVGLVAPRAGAEVLLSSGPRGAVGGEQRRQPVLVVAARGQGRVGWFGGRHLWELAFWESARRTDGDDARHAGRRLLRNLLVWSASGLDESGLVFTGRQSFFQAGEPIRLGAQWRDMRGQPVRDRALNVILRTRGDASDGAAGGPSGAGADTTGEQSFAMRPSAERPGLSEVELPPLAPGRYAVQLQGAGDPPVLGPEEDLIVAAHSVEETQVRMDRRRLVQLAARGDGAFYDAGDPAEVRRLIDDLAAVAWTGDEVVQRRRLDIRLGWPLLVLVTVLLGCEWFLRRRHGLL